MDCCAMYRRHLLDEAEFDQHYRCISAQMNTSEGNKFFSACSGALQYKYGPLVAYFKMRTIRWPDVK